MRRTIWIYWQYFKQFLLARLAYKADFFASIAASALTSLSGLLFVLFLMDGKDIPDLKGWSRAEVIFIYGYSMLSMAFFSMVAPNLYSFGDRYVIQGQFDRVLLRPLNSLCQVLFESFNLEAVGHLMVGLGIFWVLGDDIGVHLNFLDFIWLIVSALSGAAILISVFIVLASTSFHFEDRIGIGAPFYSLISFARYPLPIFGKLIQFVLMWVVPFSFVAFYPATYFLGRKEFLFYCYLTPVMALICMFVAVVSWQFGVSRYSSTGN